MTEIVRIERRYAVETGEQHYTSPKIGMDATRSDIEWDFARAFRLASDAEVHAEQLSEDYEFVRIIDKGAGHD